jgi:hypothetical protein
VYISPVAVEVALITQAASVDRAQAAQVAVVAEVMTIPLASLEQQTQVAAEVAVVMPQVVVQVVKVSL